MPEVTALNLKKRALVVLAITMAIEVFPTPGGPHNTKEVSLSSSINLRSSVPFPKALSCPTISSRVRGRILSAKGIHLLLGLKSES